MNFKKFHESKNLFDAATAYGNLYNNGVVSGNTIDIYRICNSFNESQIGKQITISIKADKVTATRIFIATNISGTEYNSNSIYEGDTGVMQVTVTPQSTSDTWVISYGRNANDECVLSKIMLNVGSTPLPYEPYSSEVWHDTPHYVHNTSTDTLTTLPAVLYPNDTTATVGLKGQAVQSGTPSPSSPVMPQGTGERTAQLIPYPYYSSSGAYGGVSFTVSTDGKITASGTTKGGTNFFLTRTLVLTVGTYTASIMGTHSGMGLLIYDATNSRLLGSIPPNKSEITFDVDNNGLDIRVYFNTGGVSTLDIDCYIMLNTGSTPLPYEPFGVKIPISSANTTTPVYLGEVETTRKIKKLVFDGRETWSATTDSVYIDKTNFSGEPALAGSPLYCSHYPNDNTGMIMGGSWWFRCYDTASLTDWKSYLAAQYAAGTPVTVWYVLATPETAVVNEPLMKIGTYADEVSNITIPVTAGGDTISVDTTVQPSEVTVNYKGWHPAIIHEREDGAWT